MAIHTRNRTCTINSVDLTSFTRSVEVTVAHSEQEITTTGATNKTYSLGLPDYTTTVVFNQSYASSEVFLTLQPLIGDEDGVTCTFVPTSGSTVGQVSGTFVLVGMPIITSGEVDDVDMITVTFRPAGTVTVSTT